MNTINMKINNQMYKMKLFTECGMPALQVTNCCPLFKKINKKMDANSTSDILQSNSPVVIHLCDVMCYKLETLSKSAAKIGKINRLSTINSTMAVISMYR